MADAAVRDASPFRSLFARWSKRVRLRLALGHVLTGAGLLGAAAGFAVARRRRWSDGAVALYLDGTLGAHEAIATAVELDTPREGSGEDGGDDARAVVISQATEALAQATPQRVRAPWSSPWQVALPLGAAAIAYLCSLPLPPAPPAPALPPGAGTVQLAEVRGLEKIIKLGEVDARDDAQRERFKKLADDARKIRDKLKDGVEKREAQADIAKLRDGIAAERLSLGDGQQRQGLESAIGKLSANPDLRDAAKDLGDRDLTSLDDDMAKLADKLEKNDRERAQKTLEEAAEAAKKNGAPDVAKALEAERKRLEAQGKKTDKLKELAKALGDGLSPEGKDALKGMSSSGSPKDERKLSEELDKALGKLSPEERKRLAENLKKEIEKAPEDGSGGGMSKKELKDLADDLGTPEGEKRLEDELKKRAQEQAEPGTEEGERQKALEDAEKGGGDAEGELGGTPVPLPMPGGDDKPGSGAGDKDKDGDGQPGHHEDTGTGDHKGQTGVVEGGGVKARATGRINKGKPMPGMVMGRTAGKAGETANVQGTGALGAAAPEEVGGVDRSDVPEEYREQVGRYFQPK
jgi:hypothetical protein